MIAETLSPNYTEFNASCSISSIKDCVFCNCDPGLELFSTENFTVLSDPYPLTSGHLLMVSKQHYSCMGVLPATLMDEYKYVCYRTEKLLKESFGDFIRYEHGRAGHCFNTNPLARFCHHFHEHWVPASIDLHPTLSQNYRSYAFTDASQVPALFDRYGNYLLFENTSGEKRFYIADRKVPSHYIRTLIALELGYPERQNWEAYSSFDHTQKGKSLLKLLNNKTCAA